MTSNHPCGYERWSIRNAQRHLAAQEVDPRDKEALAKLMGKRNPTIAEMIAIKQLSKAMAGDNHAIDSVTDNVDGKLPDTVIMPQVDKLEKVVLECVDATKRPDTEQT